MKSSANEIVPLLQPVQVTSEIETWLSHLASCMEETLKQMLIDCVGECDYNKYPSQVLCVAELVQFARRTEQAIEAGGGAAFVELQRELKENLAHLTETDTADDHLMDLKIKALVLDLIHNIDVVDLLIANNVTSVSDWLWQKQNRVYLKEDGQAVVRMVDAEFDYSYEYQGNAGKLVHTPLTDKCYLVLTQGMHLGYGGNPYGPAGTGKTESVKALGAFLGRQVLVFNCDEGIDFESMGRIFTGLVKSGAWGCFDEFNRLKEDQLSAVSQQIQTIQAALKNREPECILLNKNCEVNANAAIFVTMNPASKEYGGRSKLHHNLQQLFRDVAMTVPDVS
jgi:dynein heavy chain 2